MIATDCVAPPAAEECSNKEVQVLRRFFSFLVLVACCCVNGCGYHLSRPESSLVAGGKTISIPVFANKSYRPNLEAILTGSMVDEFAMRSGGRVMAEDAADLVLSGTIVSYSKTPVSYTARDTIKEYRATMTMEATLREKKTRKVLWKGSDSLSQDFPATPIVSVQQNNVDIIALQQNSEDAAIREICRKLARQVYQKITEDF
ncbi:MAG: hypothetical protein FD174_1322 [Geobacteraceae bacterium]|nr:MAG: hypothetical protein FD174_1322 [Geobacteraceae bacterium]